VAEAVASSRGVTVKITTDEKEAMEWLEMETAKGKGTSERYG